MVLPGLEQLEEKTRKANEASDPTAVLLADHEWLRSLINGLHTLVRGGQNLALVSAAIHELKPRLELHIKREEEAYFPAIEVFMEASGQGSTFDMYGEHDAIRIRMEQLLTALERRGGAPDAFAAFSRSVLIHFDNEEELIFSDAPTQLSGEVRRDILEKFAMLAA